MKLRRLILSALIIIPMVATALFNTSKVASANFSLFSDTLSTSRLSVSGRIGTVQSNYVFSFNPAAATGYNSTSSANLRTGDTIYLNNVANVVDTISATSSTQFAVTTSSAATVGQNILYKSYPVHRITFRTANTVANGFFRVLIPASITQNNNDNLPDPDGFDFNSFSATYATATAVTGKYSWNLTTATQSAGTWCTTGYHCFEFHYNGTGDSGYDINLYIGDGTSTAGHSLLAPAPASGHFLGIADSYPVIVQQFPDLSNPLATVPTDQSKGRVALIEAVRVTATVDPTITFQIAGVNSGLSACGVSTTVSTTTGFGAPIAVPFGSLTLNSFNDAAHTLVVSTNAASGYTVTTQENNALGLNGGTTTTIPDATCDATCLITSTAKPWTVATSNYGFGYATGDASGATIPFNGFSVSGRPFPNASLGHTPQTVMSSTGPSNSHTAHVCYRVSVGAAQSAGDYENMVTYIATASF